MNRKESTQNSLFLLSGAGLGALAMYLLDPERGAERRKRLGETAGSAVQGTQEALSSRLEAAREKASEVGHAATSRASLLGKSLADVGQRVSSPMGSFSKLAGRRFSGGLVERLPEQMRHLSEETADRLGYLLSGRSRKVQAGSTFNKTILAIGCIALGMGIMYVLDPAAGRRRRSLARDKMRSSLGDVSTSVRKRGRDLWNRTSGAMADLRYRATHRQVSDATLVERIRSEMGHYVSEPSSIEVSAHSGGVTLRGPIPAQEVDSLLKCVWSVPGVVEIVNQLDIRQPAQAVSDLPGEQTGSAI